MFRNTFIARSNEVGLTRPPQRCIQVGWEGGTCPLHNCKADLLPILKRKNKRLREKEKKKRKICKKSSFMIFCILEGNTLTPSPPKRYLDTPLALHKVYLLYILEFIICRVRIRFFAECGSGALYLEQMKILKFSI